MEEIINKIKALNSNSINNLDSCLNFLVEKERVEKLSENERLEFLIKAKYSNFKQLRNKMFEEAQTFSTGSIEKEIAMGWISNSLSLDKTDSKKILDVLKGIWTYYNYSSR